MQSAMKDLLAVVIDIRPTVTKQTRVKGSITEFAEAFITSESIFPKCVILTFWHEAIAQYSVFSAPPDAPFHNTRKGKSSAMSFFFKAFGPRSATSDLVRATKDSLLAVDTKTVAKALEEVEKNIASLRQMLCGDGEAEPNQEQVSQLASEICKEDILSLFVHKLPSLGWDARKDLVYCWAILLRQTVGTNYCCVDYIENHLELLDFLIGCYSNKEIAPNCGNMMRECIKYQSLAKYVLESTSFELFFKYVELPNFDVASDALATFKELLTKHENVVSQYLSTHYEQFFELYENLLASPNYVTRRQSLKLLSDFLLEPSNSQIMKRYILEVRFLKTMMALLKDKSKNIQISAFHIFKVFVANPHKPRQIIEVLARNHGQLLMLVNNLPTSGEDEQLEEEKDLITKEIERISRLPDALS